MKDKDLLFLEECSNDQIKMLADILVYDKDGKTRNTESLTKSHQFVECYPNNLKKALPLIIDEFQRFGGDSIMNIIRGGGVCYREILQDVCKKVGAKFNKEASIESIENCLLEKILVTSVEKMSDEDIVRLSNGLSKTKISSLIGSSGKFLLARALPLLTLPFLTTVSWDWFISDITGPAYRVTIPATITIAYFRAVLNMHNEE